MAFRPLVPGIAGQPAASVLVMFEDLLDNGPTIWAYSREYLEAGLLFGLAGGAVAYSAAEAFEAVCEYAFATETLKPDADFPGAFAPEEVPRFAYRTYDCIPASEGPGFTDLDLLVTAGLNARIDMRALARLRSFADRAAADLDLAYTMQPDFLYLTRDEVGNNPPSGSAGWHLYRAWQQGMATPLLDIARVHKTLHHKRPRLVPLLDNRTIVPVGNAAKAAGCTGWQVIWDEIHGHATHFKQLADQFDEHARSMGGVSLSWPRLYDILVWMWIASGRSR